MGLRDPYLDAILNVYWITSLRIVVDSSLWKALKCNKESQSGLSVSAGLVWSSIFIATRKGCRASCSIRPQMVFGWEEFPEFGLARSSNLFSMRARQIPRAAGSSGLENRIPSRPVRLAWNPFNPVARLPQESRRHPDRSNSAFPLKPEYNASRNPPVILCLASEPRQQIIPLNDPPTDSLFDFGVNSSSDRHRKR